MRRRRRAAACLRTKVRWVAEDRVRLEDRAGSLKISGPEVAQCLPMVRGELCEAGSRIFREVWVTDFVLCFEATKGAPGAPFVFMLTWWLC